MQSVGGNAGVGGASVASNSASTSQRYAQYSK